MPRSLALSSVASLAIGLGASLCLDTKAHADETSPATSTERPRQVLIVSFDGAADNRLWERSRAIAARSNAHFTYFLSCTNLIDRAAKDTYQAPGKKQGRSNVGFAPSAADIAVRLDHLWKAHLEGHEIASHGCGHFDGKDWTSADWQQEFQNFDRVLKEAWKVNGVADKEPAGWVDFVANGIVGFRAPYLSQSGALETAERKVGFAYDASQISRGPVPPTRDGKLVSFSLPLIPEGPKDRRIIAMDYNLFVRHSMGVENPSRSAEFEERSYAAFKAAFDAQYDGDRIPLQIGLHFVEMNGGAYWRAMERLVSEVCPRADVACVSYADAVAGMGKPEENTASSGL